MAKSPETKWLRLKVGKTKLLALAWNCMYTTNKTKKKQHYILLSSFALSFVCCAAVLTGGKKLVLAFADFSYVSLCVSFPSVFLFCLLWSQSVGCVWVSVRTRHELSWEQRKKKVVEICFSGWCDVDWNVTKSQRHAVSVEFWADGESLCCARSQVEVGWEQRAWIIIIREREKPFESNCNFSRLTESTALGPWLPHNVEMQWTA